MEVHLAYLTAFDPQQVDPDVTEYQLMEKASLMLDEYLQQFNQCQKEFSEDGNIVELPYEKPTLPREKRLPEPKGTTKWQKFAEEKGIKKHKRDRFVYDEETKEERPRFGYGRTSKNTNDGIIEVRGPEIKDPFLEMKQKKKEKIEKNIDEHKKNQKWNANHKGKRGK